VDAEIPDIIEGSRQVGAGGKLILPFLKIHGGLEYNRFVDFKISVVGQRIFKEDNLSLWNRLLGRLEWLKNKKPNDWDRIKRPLSCAEYMVCKRIRSQSWASLKR